MLMSVLSHLLSAWFAFLLPSYSTFKALSHRPLSEPDLEKWAMYWTVIGAFVAFEYIAERLISWLPFYWEIKTLLLLFLSIPQIQGSTFVYTTYLRPFFIQNEADLDAGIVAVQRNTLTFLQTRLATLWAMIWDLLNKRPQSGAPSTSGGDVTSPAPTPLESLTGLWRNYAPTALGALQSYTQPKTNPAPASPPPFASTSSFSASTTSLAERRFPKIPDAPPVLPNPFGSPPISRASDSHPPFPEPSHF